MMTPFARNIKAIREQNGLTQEGLSLALGLNERTAGRWEQKNMAKPRQPEIIELIKEKFGVTDQDLFGFTDGYYAKVNGLTNMVPAVPGHTYAPVVADIAAGEPREVFEYTGEQHYVDPDIAARYPDGVFIRVSGDSMNRILQNGSYAYIAKQEQFPAQNGDVIAVKVNGDDATLKRVKFFEGLLILEPDSTDPSYQRIVIDENSPDAPAVRIIGKVVWSSYEGVY